MCVVKKIPRHNIYIYIYIVTWYFLYHAHYRFYHFFRVLNFERRVTRVICTQLNQLIGANELFDNQLHTFVLFFSVHRNHSEPLGAQSQTHTSGGSIQRRRARRGSWSRCMDVIPMHMNDQENDIRRSCQCNQISQHYLDLSGLAILGRAHYC